MQNLITQATDSFLSSFVIKSKEMMLEFLLSLIEMINTHLMNLFETPIIPRTRRNLDYNISH